MWSKTNGFSFFLGEVDFVELWWVFVLRTLRAGVELREGVLRRYRCC